MIKILEHPMPLGCKEHERLWSDLAGAIRLLVSAQVARLVALRDGGRPPLGYEPVLLAAATEWMKPRKSYTEHVNRTWLLKLVDPWIRSECNCDRITAWSNPLKVARDKWHERLFAENPRAATTEGLKPGAGV